MQYVNYVFAICMMHAVFTILAVDKGGKYYVNLQDIEKICKTSALVNFPVDHVLLQTYPLNEKIEQYVNEHVHSFWQEIDKLNLDCDLSMRKRHIFNNMLAQKNLQMKSIIQQIEYKTKRSLAYIIWGYALLVIHHQIVHDIL